jgi:hypothetical protein
MHWTNVTLVMAAGHDITVTILGNEMTGYYSHTQLYYALSFLVPELHLLAPAPSPHLTWQPGYCDDWSSPYGIIKHSISAQHGINNRS